MTFQKFEAIRFWNSSTQWYLKHFWFQKSLTPSYFTQFRFQRLPISKQFRFLKICLVIFSNSSTHWNFMSFQKFDVVRFQNSLIQWYFTQFRFQRLPISKQFRFLEICLVIFSNSSTHWHFKTFQLNDISKVWYSQISKEFDSMIFYTVQISKTSNFKIVKVLK